MHKSTDALSASVARADSAASALEVNHTCQMTFAHCATHEEAALMHLKTSALKRRFINS